MKVINVWRLNDSSCFATYPNNNNLPTFKITSTQPIATQERVIDSNITDLKTLSDATTASFGNFVHPMNSGSYERTCDLSVATGEDNNENIGRRTLQRSLSMDFKATTIGCRRKSLNKSYSDLLNFH